MSAAISPKVNLPKIGPDYIEHNGVIYVPPGHRYTLPNVNPPNWGKPGGVFQIRVAQSQLIQDSFAKYVKTVIDGINDPKLSLHEMHVKAEAAYTQIEQATKQHFLDLKRQLEVLEKEKENLTARFQQLTVKEHNHLENLAKLNAKEASLDAKAASLDAKEQALRASLLQKQAKLEAIRLKKMMEAKNATAKASY